MQAHETIFSNYNYPVPFRPRFIFRPRVIELSSRLIVVSFKALEETTATAIFTNQAKVPSQQISSFCSSFFYFFSIHLPHIVTDHVAIVLLQLPSNQRQSLEVTCFMNDNKSRLKNLQLVSSTPVARRENKRR